jgi:O-Antigen ligase
VRVVKLDLVLPVLLAATLVAFATGSSSVVAIVHAGRVLRWVALLALLGAAAALAREPAAFARLRRSVLAAALVFLALVVESAVWSVNPRLTLERAATLVVLFATAASLAAGSARRPEVIRRVLWGIVAGAAVVTLLGLAVLAFDHAAAVEPASLDLPARYQGYGENPDTVSLLLALCLPIATWLAFHARTRRELAAAVVAVIAFDASIAASGSRGAIAAGFTGMLVAIVFARSPVRVRVFASGVALVLLVATILVALAPKSKGEASAHPQPSAAVIAAGGPQPKPGYENVEADHPFAFDIGTQEPGEAAPTHRTLFGLTGRGEAWRGALDLADARAVLGYGFGTEGNVFVDRYANFAGGSPENSYIGVYLQVGAAGLVAFIALLGALALAAFRGRARPEALVSIAVLAAALVMAIVQSYIYSVGDIGTVTVWVCAFLAAVVGRRAVA